MFPHATRTAALAAALALGARGAKAATERADSGAAWRSALRPPGLARPHTAASGTGAARGLDPALFQVHEATLKNGLGVLLLADRSVPTASYYTFFKVGSRNERPGITGISHFFEHMMFNGAKKYGPKEFDRALEAQGGYSNAYTSNDLTVYYEDFARDALALVIDLESDRMRSLAFAPKLLESEREVVKEERRLRVDNDVLGRMEEELNALLFKAHPYQFPVIGWMADLDAITRSDCLAHFRTYYAPNNALVVVVGDIDPPKALRAIKKAYGDIPRGPPPPKVVQSEPEQAGERRAVVKFPAQAPALMVGWHAPAASDPDTFALDVAQTILGTGEGARLKRALVYGGGREAVSVALDFGWRIDPGVFAAWAELKPDADPARAEAVLDAEIRRLAEEGPTAAELERARAILRADFLREIATHSGRAHALGKYQVLFGSWRALFATLEKYAAVGADDVKRVVARYLRPDGKNVVTLVPEAAP